MRRVNPMEGRHSSAASALRREAATLATMPHYRTRPMLVARGVQPVGPDRRAPCRTLPPVDEAVVPGEVEAKVDVKVDANADADDRKNTDKSS
jgi:hypothetical protein